MIIICLIRPEASEVANIFVTSCGSSRCGAERGKGQTEAKKRGKGTYLDGLVPAGGVDNGVLGWRALDRGNPVLVGLQGLDTVTKSVPDLDGLVSGSRNKLSHGTGDGNGHDVAVVAVESRDTLTV